jgi:chromosome segregation ATPase
MRTTLILLLGLLWAGSLHAADAAAEAKLRDNLRKTLLQLRQIQGERDAFQADKAQLEQDKKDISDKLEATTKQAAANQKTADAKIAELGTKLLNQENEIVQYKEALEKWKVSQKQAADLAQKKEAERAKLAQQSIELQRRVDDQQRKNAEMFRISLEVLKRYEKFGLGTALTAREPFVGTTRVKLESLVQEYHDKLADQKIKAVNPASTQ